METDRISLKNADGLYHEIYFRTWGDKSQRPLFCVHGLTGSSADFKFIGEQLSSKGYFVIAPDMPGRGQSSRLVDSSDYNFDLYLSDLRALFKYLNLSTFDWLGVSMGGLLGIILAGQEKSPIAKMVLSDVGPEVPQAALDAISGYLALSPAFSTLEDVINAFKQTKRTPFSRGDDMSEEHWRYYAETHVCQNSQGLWVRSFDPAIAVEFARRPLGNVDLWSFWDQISQPVLALRGEYSTLFTPDIVDRMRKRKQGYPMDFAKISKAGHVPSLYPSQEIGIISDWLRKTS